MKGDKMRDKTLAYPVILIPAEEGRYSVEVPDLKIHTQGESIEDALFMAKDAIEMMGVYLQDVGEPIPDPSDINTIRKGKDDIKTLVLVNVDEYRRATEKKMVRKVLSIPSWLNFEAEKEGINFSAMLQEALKLKLGVKE